MTDDLTREAHRMRIVGHTDLGGHGDTMHVNVRDGVAYVGHMGGDRVGTSIVDVSDPAAPRVMAQLETPVGTHSHKVQLVGDVLVVNYEHNFLEPGAPTWEAGIKLFDVSTPWKPRELGFLPTPGKGVHRMKYLEPPYAYLAASAEGYSDQILIVADLSDPERPVEVGRWAPPGMNVAAGESPHWPEHRRYAHHHANIRGDRAYATWWDAGLYILDISDPAHPEEVAHLEFGESESSCTHTALPLPGRDVLVVADEAMNLTHAPGAGHGISEQSRRAPKRIRLVDVSDERAPRVVSVVPEPEGDFASRPGRFGPHNLHEMRPGSFRSGTIVHATYFNAGVRVYDVADAEHPREIASIVPRPWGDAEAIQMNDLFVDAEGLVYATDRAGGGLYIIEAELDAG